MLAVRGAGDEQRAARLVSTHGMAVLALGISIGAYLITEQLLTQ
jgi:hypothetical protein